MTLISFWAKSTLLSAVITTAITLDDWPIFTRVEMLGSTASVTSNSAASIDGFFSTSSRMRLAPASVVDAPTGTTAPFSAMSGPVMVTSLLSAGPEVPSAFIRSPMVLASNAACDQAACAAWGSSPSPASAAATDALRVSISRRVCMSTPTE